MNNTSLISKTTKRGIPKNDPVFEDFKMIMVLGRGTFGKVFLAELSLNKKMYAVKAIRKDILIGTDAIKSTLLE